MNRYFFDIEDGRSSRDAEGTELQHLREARGEAVKLLGVVLAESSATFWDDPELQLTVRDDSDLTLMRITVFGTLAPVSR